MGVQTLTSYTDVVDAARLCRNHVVHTPLVRSSWLSDEFKAEVLLKLETEQLTGSFKVRGALSALTRYETAEVVLTASAGNHGLGLAEAARRLNRRARVFVSSEADPLKLKTLYAHDHGDVVQVEGTYDDAERVAQQEARRADERFISSYNDRWVVAGQGTVALEILAARDDVDAIVAPVGCGGLISGLGLVARERGDIQVIGVEPEASPAVSRSVAAGHVVRIADDGGQSVAEALVGNLDADSITVPLAERVVDEIRLATEEELVAAVGRLLERERIVAEPSAAAAVIGIETAVRRGAETIACVLSGANVSRQRLHRVISARRHGGDRDLKG